MKFETFDVCTAHCGSGVLQLIVIGLAMVETVLPDEVNVAEPFEKVQISLSGGVNGTVSVNVPENVVGVKVKLSSTGIGGAFSWVAV